MIACGKCHGEGYVEVYGASFRGSNGVWEREPSDVVCGECDGTGEAKCEGCAGVATLVHSCGTVSCEACG